MSRHGWIMIVLFAVVSVTICLLFVRQCSVQPERKLDTDVKTKQRLEENRKALRKTAEFLIPDTKSELRFGPVKSPRTTPSPSATPLKP